MSSESEIFLFDATNYPGFERAISLSKRSGLTVDDRVEGIAVVVIFVIVILFLLYTGLPEEETTSFILALTVCVLLLAAIAYILLRSRVITAIPVRIAQDDMLVFGRKRWPLSDISEIVAWGGFGAVEFKNANGKTIALIDRAQFGSYDDFLMVIGRLHPEIKANREYAPVKVRVPSE